MNPKSNPEKSSANPASVQKVSNRPSSGGRISPTTVEHWKTRVYLPTKTMDGVIETGTVFVVKVQFAGRRETFNLRTSSRDTAARTARDVYLCLVQQGWDATLSRFKPKPKPKAKEPTATLTVGSMLTALEKPGVLNVAGLISYRTKLRTVMGAISQVGSGHKTGVNYRDWRAKIDALPLTLLTNSAFVKLREEFEARHPNDPQKRTSARRTFDNLLRHIRSLFREEIRTKLQADGILIPSSPVNGIKFLCRGKSTFKYVSNFSVTDLIGTAVGELKTKDPRLFLVFVFAVVLGLRRNEIDKLQWSSIAWTEKELRINPGEFFAAKREESERRLALDDGTLAVLHTAYKAKVSDWVIPSRNKARLNKTYSHYRCAGVFDQLCAWLRAKGISAQKPLHTMRKEAGSKVNDVNGIIAAQHFLGHGSPETTWTYYVSEKAPKPSGLGALLG